MKATQRGAGEGFPHRDKTMGKEYLKIGVHTRHIVLGTEPRTIG